MRYEAVENFRNKSIDQAKEARNKIIEEEGKKKEEKQNKNNNEEKKENEVETTGDEKMDK